MLNPLPNNRCDLPFPRALRTSLYPRSSTTPSLSASSVDGPASLSRCARSTKLPNGLVFTRGAARRGAARRGAARRPLERLVGQHTDGYLSWFRENDLESSGSVRRASWTSRQLGDT